MDLCSEIDKAWMAGFIDGEGYIGIVRSKKTADSRQSASFLYHPWLIVTSTDKNIIDDLILVCPCAKRALNRPTAGHKIAYQVKITQQAKFVIDFCKLRNGVKIITGRGSRGVTSFGKPEEQIYVKLLELNRRGV